MTMIDAATTWHDRVEDNIEAAGTALAFGDLERCRMRLMAALTVLTEGSMVLPDDAA